METNEWQSLLCLCSYVDVYTQYFQAGYTFLKEKKKEILEMKMKAEKVITLV